MKNVFKQIFLQEMMKTEIDFIDKITVKCEQYQLYLENNSESLEIDEEICLTFQHEKLDQFCRIVKEYREKLSIYKEKFNDESILDEYLDNCIENLSKFLENDQYLETFIVNAGFSQHCKIWLPLYRKVTNYNNLGLMINQEFMIRMGTYVSFFENWPKQIEKSTKIEKKLDSILKKLIPIRSKLTVQAAFLFSVKKNSEFLQAIELYNFDFILVGLKFEIFDSKIENQLFENGSVAISKQGELLLFKSNSIEDYTKFGLFKLDSDSGKEFKNQIELLKVVDIKDVYRYRLMYEKKRIRINSKEFQIVFRFEQGKFQASMWNSLIMKRKDPPTYFQIIKANEKYQDVHFNFE